jgi:hypothetical protein
MVQSLLGGSPGLSFVPAFKDRFFPGFGESLSGYEQGRDVAAHIHLASLLRRFITEKQGDTIPCPRFFEEGTGYFVPSPVRAFLKLILFIVPT